jgi:hypothetical protein
MLAARTYEEVFDRLSGALTAHRFGEGFIFLSAGMRNKTALMEFISRLEHKKYGRLIALGESLLCQLEGDWRSSAEKASSGLNRYKGYSHLAFVKAISLLALGESLAALETLTAHLDTDRAHPSLWLLALVHFRLGDMSAATDALEKLLGPSSFDGKELDETFILSLWDEHLAVQNIEKICYYMPIMPGSLVGLDHDLCRVPFAASTLPSHIGLSRNSGQNNQATASCLETADSTKQMRHEPGRNLSRAKNLFYSYSHIDEPLRDQLEVHLTLLSRQGIISSWHDRKIIPGVEWDHEIDKQLDQAAIILLLVSADFIASKYCWDKEVKRALELHAAKQATVVPVLLRPCDWHGAPFGKLQGLPKDMKAVTEWPDRDAAWTDVAKGIRAVAEL